MAAGLFELWVSWVRRRVTRSFSSCSLTIYVWIQWKDEQDNIFPKAYIVFSATKDVLATHRCLQSPVLLPRCLYVLCNGIKCLLLTLRKRKMAIRVLTYTQYSKLWLQFEDFFSSVLESVFEKNKSSWLTLVPLSLHNECRTACEQTLLNSATARPIYCLPILLADCRYVGVNIYNAR